MFKSLIGLSLLISLNSFASIPKDTHLGCQLYTGESSVFYELRKFNISKADSKGERTLDAYLTADGEGTCYNTLSGSTIECEYTNSKDQLIVVTLDEPSTSEVEGTVFYDGWLNKSHKVSCELLTF
ncbi:hypothetical protein [Halobacteriovorax sp.]|uniref:hypothetical protein n=1 Tax=Halobacteriovorax sp. TaxID=2020862 RepID=UPI00356336EA